MLKKHSNLIVIFILSVVFVVSLVVSRQESTIMDEQAHIPAGYSYVKYNDMRLNPEHPPLLKDLAGLFLLPFNPKFPTETAEWQNGINEQWTLGKIFIHSNNADQITFWSRFPIILIALLLGFFIYKWTKELAGTAAGLFALLLYAADPNILGHNHYVTTDLGIAAFIFIAFYFFIRFLKKPIWKNVLLAGIFLSLAELAKFSGVLLFPIFTLAAVIYAIFKKVELDKSKIREIGEYAGKYILVIVICFVSIWILYQYNTFNMPPEKVQDIARTVFGDTGSGKIAKSVVIQMSTLPLLKGMSEYFLGVFMVFVRITGGNTYYFLGKVSNHASQSYFPIVFLLKETLAMLILILFSLFYGAYGTLKNIFSGNQEFFITNIWEKFKIYLRESVVQYSMLGFILLYAYLSVTGNLNIGFRHLFPILPVAYVLVSKTIFGWLKKINSEITKKTLGIILALFCVWIILEPVIAFPSYLSYYNEIAGGHLNGYKYVADSNTDWGQDLKRLNNWVKKNNIDKIRVDYFGGASPAYYLGDKFVPWHSGLDEEPGWYAISATFLEESIHREKNPGDKSYEWILKYEPIRIGDSIFVYHVL
jgi:hypothetical protein